MKAIIYILIGWLFIVACHKTSVQLTVQNNLQFPDLRTTTSYFIKAGNHYCDQNFPQIMNRNSMSAFVTFDSSAIYKSIDPGNQADVNKLMGFSDCGSNHEENSARIGWSWTGKELALYAYCYVNKIRVIKTLGNFNLNKPIRCSIKAGNGYFFFKTDDILDSIPRYCSDYNGSRYKLFPYFGGDEVAPHDVRILIEED